MTDRKVSRMGIGLGRQEDADLVILPEEGHALQTAPAKEPRTPAEWMRENLFSSWGNAIITVVAATVVAFALFRLFRFVFVTAEWGVIQANMKGYMAGPFPIDEIWRVWVCLYLVVALAGVSVGLSRRRVVMTPRRIATSAIVGVAAVLLFLFVVQTTVVRVLSLGVVVVLAVTFVAGRALGPRSNRVLIAAWIALFPVLMIVIRAFDGVSPRLWGGFFFNIIAAVVGIFMSFPIGILLALGRRSSLPAIRIFCVGFIELFRGVPLVGWLIFSKYIFDLLLPPQMNLPDIIKALAAMTFFSSAYVGEIVRGGLQGIDKGQYEAARALGLPTTRLTILIVLPQALRATIPAMISHFISLFKDTSLFTAIEWTDLLAAAFRSAASLEFLQTDREVLLFAALMFWMVAFSMSRWSQRLEVRLGVGER